MLLSPGAECCFCFWNEFLLAYVVRRPRACTSFLPNLGVWIFVFKICFQVFKTTPRGHFLGLDEGFCPLERGMNCMNMCLKWKQSIPLPR